MSLSALNNTGLIDPASLISTKASDAEAKAEEDSLQYLEILLIQLENQNPMEPMETSELTNQLIIQSQLEQLINTNTKIDQLVATYEESTSTAALNYLGATVEVLGNEAPVQNGISKWSYYVDGPADTVTLNIVDFEGNVLHSQEGSATPGAHDVYFIPEEIEGLDLPDGSSVFLEVEALDAEGNALSSSITSYAVIDGVDTSTGELLLSAGGIQMNKEFILKINYDPFAFLQPVDPEPDPNDLIVEPIPDPDNIIVPVPWGVE